MLVGTRLASTLGLAAVLAVAMTGCDNTPAAAPTTSPAAAPTSPSGCAIAASGPAAEASVLVPGPINGVPASTAVGEPLTIVATVLGPGCQAASEAEIMVWHTDARGLYGPGAGTDECCYYGGTVRTDANGRFELDTIRPAQYPQASAPPAHIHFEMTHSSGRLDTEIVFDAGSPDPGPVQPSNVIPVVADPDRWPLARRGHVRPRIVTGFWAPRARFDRTPIDMAAYERRGKATCFVCAFLAGEADYHHETVYEDDAHIAFLSRYPTMTGYVIVSPKAHVDHVVRDQTEAEFLRMMTVVRRVALAVEAVTEPERTYLVSVGSQQGNSHLHWHIAPLPPGVPYEQQQFNALRLEHGVVDQSPAQAAELAERIRGAIRASFPRSDI